MTIIGKMTPRATGHFLSHTMTWLAAGTLALLLPFTAAAEPVKLKLAFYGSESANTYRYGIKPFVDAVNAEGKDLVTIEVFSSGKLGRAVAEQPRLVLDGLADIAFIIPGQTPHRFPENEVLELPGLFHNTREGTLVYTRLTAANALRGYQDFFVIGAYTTGPTFINSRKPVPTLAALRGLKIRGNNATEAEALNRLGATPMVLEAPRVAHAIDAGSIDGAALAPNGLVEFGVGNSVKYHYLLEGGAAPLLLLMSRKTLDGLPDAAKALIIKYSGERAAATWIEGYGAAETQIIEKFKADPTRNVVIPSATDQLAAQKIHSDLIGVWAAKADKNSKLLAMVEKELAAIRSGR